MKKIKWTVSLESLTYEDEFEVEEFVTDEEIEKIAREEVFNMINWWYTVEIVARSEGERWIKS